MGTNRERRAAKQRRRDQKRGRTAGPVPAVDRGLSAEALRRILTDAAADLAAGRAEALTELRHLLAEHLARRRGHVLAACDEVLAAEPADVGSTEPASAWALAADADADTDADAALARHLAGGGTATSWADAAGATTEDTAVATVRVLAHRMTAHHGA